MSIGTANINETRASYGESVVSATAALTGSGRQETAETSVIEVLSFIAHFCDRLGIDAETTFKHAMMQYNEDIDSDSIARTLLLGDDTLLKPFDE